MDYAEARAAFFQPRAAGSSETGTATWQSPARALRDAIEPLATICFWAEPAYDEYAAAGLDFLQGYVWARGSVLGEPAGAVVASSFGVFEPGLIVSLYDSARAVCSLADVRAAKLAGAVTSLRRVLGEPAELAGLADVVAALRRGADAADPYARPLHAGLTALPWPEDDLGRLWHACSILREHRGDGHLMACVAAGLNAVQANLLTEMAVGWEPQAYTASRGWSAEAMADATEGLCSRGLADADGRLTDEGRAFRVDIEDTTDRLARRAVDAIGDDLPRVVEACTAWSARVIEHGWFPPDPYKRAAG